MYILNLLLSGGYFTLSIILLASSTLRLDAPSISTTSTLLPFVMLIQDSHSLHGSELVPFSQLSDLAIILAVDVFPTPIGPASSIAWCSLSASIAFLRILTAISCPMISDNLVGLYFLAKTLYITSPLAMLTQAGHCALAQPHLPLLPSGPGGVQQGVRHASPLKVSIAKRNWRAQEDSNL